MWANREQFHIAAQENASCTVLALWGLNAKCCSGAPILLWWGIPNPRRWSGGMHLTFNVIIWFTLEEKRLDL